MLVKPPQAKVHCYNLLVVEVLISNMTLWPLAGLKLEYTGWVAKKLGFDGVEHVPTLAGLRQITSEKISIDQTYIKSAHWSWRMPSFIILYPSNPFNILSALITYLFLLSGLKSQDYLTKLQTILDKTLPVVLDRHLLNNIEPRDMPFEKTIQITPLLLSECALTTPEQLASWLQKNDTKPVFDTQHSALLRQEIKDFVLKNATEIHVRSGWDLGSHHSANLDFLDYCVSAKRIVVEMSFYTPWSLAKLNRAIRSKLAQL